MSLRSCLQRIMGAQIPPESWEGAVLPNAIRWIGPPEWTKGEPSGILVQLGRLSGDHRQTTACEQLVTALTNGEPGSHLVAVADVDLRGCWRQVSTHQVGEISLVTTLRAQGTTTWTMGNQGPGKGGRLSLRCLWRNSL